MGFSFQRRAKVLPGTLEMLLVGAAYLGVALLCLFLVGFCIEVTDSVFIGFLLAAAVMAMVATIGVVAAMFFEHRSMHKKLD